MPAISLIVCLHREKQLLDRLLIHTAGLFNNLVVVHDGPEQSQQVDACAQATISHNPPAIDYSELKPGAPPPVVYRTPSGPAQDIHRLVQRYDGKYFEGPRCFQQEPHWPFAWSQAAHDWILRLDADELPSDELKKWLEQFRKNAEPPSNISGYTCIWPIWNGKKTVTRHWPDGRNFLFHRRRVRFFGIVEHVPVADGRFEIVPVVLRHEPLRKSHGLLNILRRKQGGRWRSVIAQSLLCEISELPRWRWTTNQWPTFWDRLRKHPLRAGIYFFFRNTFFTVRELWRREHKFMPLIAVATPLHHLIVGITLYRLQKANATKVK